MMTSKASERARPISRNTVIYDVVPSPREEKRGGPSAALLSPGRPVVVEPKSPRVSAPLGAAAAIFVLALGLFVYAEQNDVLLGQIVAVVTLPFALHGLWRGGIVKFAMLAATVGLIWGGAVYGDDLIQLMADQGIASGSIGRMLTLSVLATVLWFLVRVGAAVVQHAVVRRRPMRLRLDRAAGTLLGAGEGVLLLACLCWGAMALRPFGMMLADPNNSEPGSMRQRVGEAIVTLSDEAGAGRLGAFLRSTNPVQRSPSLDKLIRDLNTTGRIDPNSLSPQMLETMEGLLKRLPITDPDQLQAALERIEQLKQSKQ